jgi:hypothetical protein
MMKEYFTKFRQFLSEQATPVTLYHYSRVEKESFVLDPDPKYRTSHSRREFETSPHPRVFFYTDAQNKEPLIQGDLYSATVDSSKIYDVSKDVDGFVAAATEDQYGTQITYWDEFYESVSEKYDGVFYTIHGDIGVVAWFKPIEVTRVK